VETRVLPLALKPENLAQFSGCGLPWLPLRKLQPSSITEHPSHSHHVTSSHRRKSVTHVFSTICRLCAGSLALSNLPVSAFAISLLASGAKLHKRFKLEILED
jgi:hypothetical protein